MMCTGDVAAGQTNTARPISQSIAARRETPRRRLSEGELLGGTCVRVQPPAEPRTTRDVYVRDW